MESKQKTKTAVQQKKKLQRKPCPKTRTKKRVPSKSVVKHASPVIAKGKIARAVKAHRKADPRFSKHTVDMSVDQALPNANPAIIIDAHMNTSGVSSIPVAIVSYALSRGYQQYVDDTSYPFFALVYMTQYILNRMSNTEVSVGNIPYWLACICDALAPKRVPAEAGAVAYRFKIDQTDASTSVGPIMQMGPTPYNIRWNVGFPTNTRVNTLWTELDVSQNYNPVEGEKAFASLSQFLAEQTMNEPHAKMHELVPSTTPTRFLRDASAYALYEGCPGGGYYDTGAFLKLVTGEVPVRSPLLSVFCPASGGLYREGRYTKFTRQFAGDGITTGGLLATVVDESQISTKKPPRVYCVDFNEFVDTMAKAMVLAGTNLVNDGIALSGEALNPDAITDKIQVKMTFQEFQLILRATLMNAFADSQFLTQGLYPTYPSGPTDNQFAPFVCGVGTCPFPTSTGMQLPELLAENVRLLTRRWNTGHRGGERDIQFYLPVLGAYFKDELQASDYVVTYKWAPGDGTPETITVPVFKPDIEFENIITDKKGKTTKVSAEQKISMFDGACGSSYVMVNDPGALNGLIDVWNDYMLGMGSFYTGTSTISTDAGINSLIMSIFTCFWKPVIVSASNAKHDRFKRKGLVDSVYSEKQIYAYSTSEQPLKANWQGVQNVLIAPVMRANDGTGPRDNNSFQVMCAGLGQPIQIPAIQTPIPYTLAERHSQMAIFLVKDRNSNTDSVNEFLKEQAKLGRGGILGGLAKAFAPIAVATLTNAIDAIPY